MALDADSSAFGRDSVFTLALDSIQPQQYSLPLRGARLQHMQDGSMQAFSNRDYNVRAVFSGTVQLVNSFNGRNLTIVISHDNGLQSVCRELMAPVVHAGEHVAAGQVIAHATSTGKQQFATSVLLCQFMPVVNIKISPITVSMQIAALTAFYHHIHAVDFLIGIIKIQRGNICRNGHTYIIRINGWLLIHHRRTRGSFATRRACNGYQTATDGQKFISNINELHHRLRFCSFASPSFSHIRHKTNQAHCLAFVYTSWHPDSR